MIKFKDFVPGMKAKGGLFKLPVMEQLSLALTEANDWILANEVDVVNIETVVLPNIHEPDEEGATDTQLHASGEMSACWYQFIRVWYRTA